MDARADEPQPGNSQPGIAQPGDAQSALAWEVRDAGSAVHASCAADGARTAAFRTSIPRDWACFRGHFPGTPVLSAAVQLQDLVLPCVARVRAASGAPTRLAGLKFLLRIEPGDTLDVRLRWRPGSQIVDFEIVRDGTRCSLGRLDYGAATGASQAGKAGDDSGANAGADRS